MSPEYVTKLFPKLATEAGVRKIRLHDLRHGAASLMLAAGIPIEVVSKRLGHGSIAITWDTYSHLLEGVGRQAADGIGSADPERPMRTTARATIWRRRRWTTVGPVGLEPTTRGLKEGGYRLPTGARPRPPRTIAGAFAQFISTIDAQLRSGSDPVGAAWLEGFWRGWRLFTAKEQRR